MVLQALWLLIFQTNTIYGFVIGEVDIIVLLGTIYYMLWVSLDSSCNWYEVVALRGGLSIYGGWVTAATLLNTAVMLKSFGIDDSTLPANFNEEMITVITMWVAFVFYELFSYASRDPFFGAVYLWVLIAIWDNVTGKKAALNYKETEMHAIIIFAIHLVSMCSLYAYLNFEDIQDLYTVPSFWAHGIDYLIRWKKD